MDHDFRPSRREGRLCHVRSHEIQSGRFEHSGIAGEADVAEEVERRTRPIEASGKRGRDEGGEQRVGATAEVMFKVLWPPLRVLTNSWAIYFRLRLWRTSGLNP